MCVREPILNGGRQIISIPTPTPTIISGNTVTIEIFMILPKYKGSDKREITKYKLVVKWVITLKAVVVAKHVTSNLKAGMMRRMS